MADEPEWRRRLAELRGDFPAPELDAEADERLVRMLVDGVRRALALRGDGARLTGERQGLEAAGLDLNADSARQPATDVRGAEDVLRDVVARLRGLPLEVHPRGQVNVNVQPSTLSLVAALLPALFNPNMSSDGRGAGCSDAERDVTAFVAELVGYDPERAGGVFTFGGTGTLLYGVKLGLERACPDTMRRGVRGDVVVLASQRCHHTCLTSAGWLGIGADQVRRVATHDDNAIDLDELARVAREELRAGRRIAAFVATVGTTDAFGLDDVARVVELRDALVDEFQLDYRPHVHADAVIGWAWSVFNDYDVVANPLGFSTTVLRGVAEACSRVRGLARADSLGVDFHKTGFVPYVSSLFVVRERTDFQRLAREPDLMPYLFHSGRYHPGLFTLETTRAAGGVLAAWANLRWLGRVGLQTLLGHALERTAELRALLRATRHVAIVNDQNVGPVTLYRAYPPGLDPCQTLHRERTDPTAAQLVEQVNDWNRRLHRTLSSGEVQIGLTTAAARAASGESLVALKSYLLSPWLESSDLAAIVRQVANGPAPLAVRREL